MIKMGIPLQAVKLKAQAEGLDPSGLDVRGHTLLLEVHSTSSHAVTRVNTPYIAPHFAPQCPFN
jgi:hypothetical protein